MNGSFRFLFFARVLPSVAAIAGLGPSAAGTEPAADVVRQGYGVLQKHCVACHGEELNYPGLNMFDRASLLRTDDPGNPAFLVPGKSAESRIFLHVSGRRQPQMPPEDQPRPTEAEVLALARWIDAGAPFPELVRTARPFVGETAVMERVAADLQSRPVEHRPFLRYVSLAHLANDPRIPDDTLALTRAAVSKLINSLSSQPRIVPPATVGDDGLLLRIDLRDYGWTDRDHWLPLLRSYPYALDHSARFGRILSECRSDVPCVRADWFVAKASRPPLYHQLLTFPGRVGAADTAGRLEQLLSIDYARNFADDRLMRAGFSGKASGVSDHNRIVERHDAPFGYYWVSFDSAGKGERFNHANFPLGPKMPGAANIAAFDHDGGEIIHSLPNGLQAYMLVNAVGERIDEGPIEIVNDPNSHSGSNTIVNGVSCMGCHKEGMLPFADSVRVQFEGRSGPVAEKVLRIYPPRQEVDRLVTEDRQRFVAAVTRAVAPFIGRPDGTVDLAAHPEPVSDVSRRYQRELALSDVARDLGLPATAAEAEAAGIAASAELLKAVILSNEQFRQLELNPLTAGEPIPREQFEQVFARVVRQLKGVGAPLIVQ